MSDLKIWRIAPNVRSKCTLLSLHIYSNKTKKFPLKIPSNATFRSTIYFSKPLLTDTFYIKFETEMFILFETEKPNFSTNTSSLTFSLLTVFQYLA